MNRICIAIAALALSAAGCRQGLGERCEVNDDCSSGICSGAMPRICVSSDQTTDQIEASVPTDAPGVGVDADANAAIDAP